MLSRSLKAVRPCARAVSARLSAPRFAALPAFGRVSRFAQQPLMRSFSSKAGDWRLVRDEASEVLTREINEEQVTMDEGTVPMPQLEGLIFKLHHEVGYNEVVLSHEHEDGTLIRVLFLAKSSEDSNQEFNSDSEGGFNELSGSENSQAEDAEAETDDAELGFTVTVSYPKEKGRGVMVYKCCYLYQDNEIILENVAFVPNLAAVPSLGQPANGYIADKLTHFAGPKLDDLDEDVQTALFKYLQSRHVDTKLCDFMLHYSYYKEQLEYMEWLSRFKRFVE